MTKATVHVVDDDEVILDSIGALLGALAFTVQTYRSGEEFLDRARPQRGDCLLLDLHMPGLNGLAVQEALKTRRIDIPVIMITAGGDVATAVRAMREGAVDFIEKPLSAETTLESIERALKQDRNPAVDGQDRKSLMITFARLTDRERQVMEQLVSGRSNKSIAAELQISPRTVEIHRARVMEKLAARNVAHLVRMALAAGIAQ